MNNLPRVTWDQATGRRLLLAALVSKEDSVEHDEHHRRKGGEGGEPGQPDEVASQAVDDSADQLLKWPEHAGDPCKCRVRSPV